jgi:hypothetical protein
MVLVINEDSLVKSPMIEISVGEGMVIKAILDTGSKINLLAESVYEKLIKLGAGVPTLPLENITLVTAFGKQANRIKKQAMIECAIGSNFFESNFFISPQLINDAILVGCQFLKEYGITLDFKRGSFTYFKDGRVQEQLFIQPAGCQETRGCPHVSEENIVPNFFFFFCIVGGGVQTGSTRHVGHLLAYCTCPG